VNRIGYGAMQLAGDNVFGPPRDRDEAIRVLRAAIAGGINHIDTAQYYGPGVFGPPEDRDAALAILRRVADAGVNHIDTAQYYGPDVANELIRAALHPYPDDLVLVSKVGGTRDGSGQWLPAQRPEDLRAGVEANLSGLGVEQVPVVNLRRFPGSEVPLDEQLAAMVALRDEGLIGGIGLSSVTQEEYRQGAATTTIACVQNSFSVADRSGQDVFDACAADGVPFVPFFPLGSAFMPDKPVLSHPAVRATAERLGCTPAQVALAWLLHLSPNVLLIPGTSSLGHLEENLAAVEVELDAAAMAALD
jgi:aryl-alcohol dehydrogenase-like predicted oxidoreductase